MTQPPVFDRFEDMMRLEPHGPDVYVGVSPAYPWGRVYGGQVVAQALKAAAATVEPAYQPHSLHGYFIRGGTSDEPIRFEVDRIRNGRSFITRRVVARQSSGAIFNLSASFHLTEGDLDIPTCTIPEGISGPDDLPAESWTPLMQCRRVPADQVQGRTAVWIRVVGPLGDEPAVHSLALAYSSDDVPFGAAASVRPDRTPDTEHDGTFVGASLDHALWFHRPGPADDWQLHVLEPLGYTGNRGLAMGQVFSRSGTHLASVAQEIVFRRARTPDSR
ncbi:MAG: acyl-CoA thioesterase [Acidimicrobiales bacterium]